MSKFDDLLSGWKNAHDKANEMLAECVSIALNDLVNAFQLSNLQKLNDAIVERKNTVRHDAFCDWLDHYLPVKMVDGKLKKSGKKSMEMNWDENAQDIVDEALKVHFWDYKPGRVVTKFDTVEAAAAQAAKSVVKLVTSRCDFNVDDAAKQVILDKISAELLEQAEAA